MFKGTIVAPARRRTIWHQPADDAMVWDIRSITDLRG
jgi:hypothetical protein